MTLLTLLAGKDADPAAIETAIRAVVQDEMSKIRQSIADDLNHALDRLRDEFFTPALQSLKDRETQAEDALTAFAEGHKIEFAIVKKEINNT